MPVKGRSAPQVVQFAGAGSVGCGTISGSVLASREPPERRSLPLARRKASPEPFDYAQGKRSRRAWVEWGHMGCFDGQPARDRLFFDLVG